MNARLNSIINQYSNKLLKNTKFWNFFVPEFFYIQKNIYLCSIKNKKLCRYDQLFEEQLYNRLDAKNACEVIMMFTIITVENKKLKIKNKKRNCLINKIFKLWHS